eukprot:6477323-Amphidinium_carterae.1
MLKCFVSQSFGCCCVHRVVRSRQNALAIAANYKPLRSGDLPLQAVAVCASHTPELPSRHTSSDSAGTARRPAWPGSCTSNFVLVYIPTEND